ncbi:MAG TPA: hypothetical protein VGC79_12070, partial [Polyangiaceae bacterium]
PWCVIKPTDPTILAWFETQKSLPVCPDGIITAANRFKGGGNDSNGHLVPGDLDAWAARGAINAGQAVFVYLDQMISQGKGRALRYDECEQLGN